MKKIAVFTSGGDAPGMNACIRAIVRGAAYHNVEVFGIVRGYNGMIKGDIIPLNSQSVSNIIQRGGTILKSARSKEFMTAEGRKKAYDKLQELGIEGLVAIGGNGTFTGDFLFDTSPSFQFQATGNTTASIDDVTLTPLGLLLAPEALGQGTGWLALATTPLLFPEAVLYLLLAKGLLLVLALGSRAPGGLLTPALVLGGLLGALVGKLPLPAALPGPEALALASGAALLAGVARAPFAALVLAAEWGGYALLPLVLPAVFVSYALTEAQSLGPEGQAAPPSETPPQTAPPPSGPEAASGPGSPRG